MFSSPACRLLHKHRQRLIFRPQSEYFKFFFFSVLYFCFLCHHLPQFFYFIPFPVIELSASFSIFRLICNKHPVRHVTTQINNTRPWTIIIIKYILNISRRRSRLSPYFRFFFFIAILLLYEIWYSSELRN